MFHKDVRHTGSAQPPILEVDLVIKPSAVKPGKNGKLTVSILSTDTFDATTVDPAGVRFGATGTEAAAAKYTAKKDANKDKRKDLTLTFVTNETGIQCGDAAAQLTGQITGGQLIAGSVAITTKCK